MTERNKTAKNFKSAGKKIFFTVGINKSKFLFFKRINKNSLCFLAISLFISSFSSELCV